MGALEGEDVGCAEVGRFVVGAIVGDDVGDAVGLAVGAGVGDNKT